MRPIAIFYHVFQKESSKLEDLGSVSWENMFKSQIERLKKSGLFDAADFIQININGNRKLPLSEDKFKVKYNTINDCEAETLIDIWNFAIQNKDYAILYMHTKGVSLVDSEFYVLHNSEIWRDYLEYFNIDLWKNNIDNLDSHDTSGTEVILNAGLGGSVWAAPHYSGNFWWANASYIATLDPSYLSIRENRKWWRWASEFWIGTKNPKMFNFYSSPGKFGKDKYNDPVTKEEAMNNLQNTTIFGVYEEPDPSKCTAKICMISMFKNESKSIGKMLESVAPYISYWVLQDNGSTDGTPDVVKEWQEKYKIPGLLYTVEEGWVGFGWNRDHLLQTTLKQDHGCDWIMKMDCDETLEVENGFDWSIFKRTDLSSFNVHAYSPGCQYIRTWIWNAKLPWRFNHDPAHETITMNGTEEFDRHNLDLKFKMIVGGTTGESYSTPTKYVSDALKLEEKMIREGTMLKDHYHFWYIGKSYEDGYVCKEVPLGETHQKELARRCIWYFEEVLHVTHPGFKDTRKATRIDEMSYYAVNAMGNACRFLGDHSKAIKYYNESEQFCPRKNDHLIHLAEIYWELMDYKKMLEITTKLIDPTRTNPFPELVFLINPYRYVDTGNLPSLLHSEALRLNREIVPTGSIFRVNEKQRKKLFVVDNFYDDPYAVRDYALKQQFNDDSRFYKGKRTIERFSTPQIKQKFEEIMGEKIQKFDAPGPYGGSMNGVFQYCTPEDALVYHYDSQKWAAMIFLTPDAPVQTGTSFYKHKETGIKVSEDPDCDRAFAGGFYDATKFELIDSIGNVFNRCIIFDSRSIHAASEYFGKNINDARLFQIFFFD